MDWTPVEFVFFYLGGLVCLEFEKDGGNEAKMWKVLGVAALLSSGITLGKAIYGS